MKKIVSLAIVISLVWCVSLIVNAYNRDGWNVLDDHVNGYSLSYPTSMQVDSSLQPIRTVLSDPDTKVEIYYDRFQGSIADSAIYMSYSNQQVVEDPNNTVEKNETGMLYGMNTHVLKWHRDKLKKMTDDKNSS